MSVTLIIALYDEKICFLSGSDTFSVLRQNLPPYPVFTEVYQITQYSYYTLVYPNTPRYILSYIGTTLQKICRQYFDM